jgi:MoaA/NifB/PqqE/SkfB family radical SAM enzyme
METLNILPGYLCNLKCTHCLNNSGPDRVGSELSEAEKKQLFLDIKKYSPPSVSFTGGEPTLYVNLINEIINSHPNLSNCLISITTNGWFAKNTNDTLKMLKSFLKLDRVQMSLDIFHGNVLNEKQVSNLKSACDELHLPFVLTMAISDPMEIVKALKYVESVNVKVIFQKVDAVGRAKTGKISFKYTNFEPEVWNKKCPNSSAVAYIAGQGYSSCCSSLVFDQKLEGITHKTLAEHLSSPFRKAILGKNMSELASDRGLDVKNLDPSLSSICRLCEWIHLGGDIREQ